MKMKKNNKKTIQNFNECYLMCIPNIDGISDAEAMDCEQGEYFGECQIYFDLIVPVQSQKALTELVKLSLSYEFRGYLTNDNKFEIVFSDNNRPKVNIVKSYANDIFDAVGDNKVNLCGFSEERFSNFALDKASKELDVFFKSMDEQFFFDFKVKKSKVKLNKTLLSQLQKNFYNDLVSVLEKVEEKNYQPLLEKYEIQKSSLEDLADAIKLAEKNYYYKKLKDELPERQEAKSTKLPKV